MRGTGGTWGLFAVHLLTASFGFACALVAVGSVIAFVPSVLNLDAATASPGQVEQAAARLLYLHATFWPVVASCLAAVVLSSFFLYRRMTAPFVRFGQAFQSVGTGELPVPIVLRSHDYMRKEAEAVNEMIRSLRSRLSRVQQEGYVLFEQIDDLVEHVAALPDRGVLLDVLSQVDVQRKRLTAELDSLGPLRLPDSLE